MTVIIGSTVWDRHTGGITPPRQVVEKKTNNDGSIKLRSTSHRQEATGQVATTYTAETEAEAVNLITLAGAMQGVRVTTALNGVIFYNVRVASVETAVVKVRGKNNWLVTGTWSFGPASPDQSEDPKDIYVPSKVETARNWGSWTERKHLVATSASEVFGPVGSVMGTASIVQVLNPAAVDANGNPDASAMVIPDVKGHYIKISLPSGTPEEIANATTLTPAWYGKITNVSIGSDNGRVVISYTCYDLSNLLDTWLTRWYELNDDGVVADGEMPGFNAIPSGELSSGSPGPDGTHVHDRTRSAGLMWKNDDIVKLFTGAFNAQFPDGPTLIVDGQLTAALGNFQSHDLDGASLREQFGQLICRGIGARLYVDPSEDIHLRISTGIKTSISAGGWTVPANDQQITVDLHNDPYRVGWNFDEETGQMADHVLYEMGFPWHCISLGINDADTEVLRKTWSPADADYWENLTEQERDGTQYAHVWRRYKLNKDWVGASYKVAPFTINVGRTTVSNATHGTSGENGEFSATGNNRFPVPGVRFTKSLPITIGDDWTGDMSSGGPGLSPIKPLDRPTVYLVDDPGGDESWSIVDMQITVDDDQPEITIGRNASDAEKIRDWLEDGKHLVVTLGVRIPRNWRVSWRRNTAARLCDKERAVVYKRPDIDYRYLMNQTIVGLDEDGNPKFSEAGVIGDKPDIGLQLLAVGRLVHENPQRGLTWTTLGINRSTSIIPGAFITNATLPYGNDPDPSDDDEPATVRTVDAPIGVRSWNLDREKPSTTISTTRLAADVVLKPHPEPAPPNVVDLSKIVYAE